MRGSILIVEDQPNFREGLKYYLEQEALGWQVVGEAGTGLEGWEMIERLNPELVFMDINMPVMNGIELARRIHEAHLDTIFVIITGYQDFNYAQSAVRYGALDFLLKPCSNDDINRILRAAFDKLAARRLFKESMRAAKENRLRSVLLCRQADKEQADWLRGCYKDKVLYLFVVKDYFPQVKNYKRKDMYLLQYGITNITDEMMRSMPEEAQGEWHLLQHDQLVIALARGFNAQLWFEKLIRAVSDYFGISLGCSVLGDGEDMDRLIQAYEKIAGKVQPLSEQNEQDSRHMTGKFRNDIMAVIVDGDIESLPAYFTEYYDSLHGMPLVQLRLSGIAHAQALNDVSESLFTNARLLSVQQIMEKISQLNDLNQIREWLSSQSADFLNQLFEWRGIVNGGMNVIQKAVRFIKLHYKEDCSISRTAEHVHMNTSYFSTLFKKETGVTYSHYVNQLRLDQAKVLLRNTNLKMIDIAQAVGINDSAYFSILFKKFFHISPSEFRQQS